MLTDTAIIAALKVKKKTLERRIASLTEAIRVLEEDSGSGSGTDPLPVMIMDAAINSRSQYDTHWTYPQKVIYILKDKGRFLHFREIAEEIVNIERRSNVDIVKFALQLSYNTSGIKNKEIVKYVVDNANQKTFWGLPQWLDSDGKPKKEFMYDLSILSKKPSMKVFFH